VTSLGTTPKELESLAALCRLREEEGKALLRGARKDRELVIAMVDCVMVVNELSAQVREDMVRSIFVVGGSQVTFEGLLANPRIQAHLCGCSEDPLVDVLQDRDRTDSVRSFPGILQQKDKDRREEEMRQRVDDLQLSLRQRDEDLQLAQGLSRRS